MKPGSLRSPAVNDLRPLSRRCASLTAVSLRLRSLYGSLRSSLSKERKKRCRIPKCSPCLTEVIHFGNDVHSSVAVLRLVDAFIPESVDAFAPESLVAFTGIRIIRGKSRATEIQGSVRASEFTGAAVFRFGLKNGVFTTAAGTR